MHYGEFEEAPAVVLREKVTEGVARMRGSCSRRTAHPCNTLSHFLPKNNRATAQFPQGLESPRPVCAGFGKPPTHISILRYTSCAGACHLRALVFQSYARISMLVIRAHNARIFPFGECAYRHLCLFIVASTARDRRGRGGRGGGGDEYPITLDSFRGKFHRI